MHGAMERIVFCREVARRKRVWTVRHVQDAPVVIRPSRKRRQSWPYWSSGERVQHFLHLTIHDHLEYFDVSWKVFATDFINRHREDNLWIRLNWEHEQAEMIDAPACDVRGLCSMFIARAAENKRA